MSNTAKLIIIGSIFATLSACSNSNFGSKGGTTQPVNTTQGGDPATNPVTDPIVTPVVTNPPPAQCLPVAAISRLTKIMFLVDSSGSNAGLIGLGATDLHKKFRLGSIQNFFQRYQAKTNFEWGFMTFSGRNATDFVGHDGMESFAANPNLMQQALNHFAQVQDWGSTPYKAALNHVINAIGHDKDLHSGKNPQYFVILLSDGFPTDIEEPVEIKNKIQELLNVDSGNVSLSSVFYGHKHEWDANEAIALLSEMAKMGHGQFANAMDPKSTINIDDVIPHAPDCPQ